MPEALVRATSLAREFGTSRDRVHAVIGATFSLEPGDAVAVVGPSGSGKSTLLHLMAGLDTPTEGSIEWPAIGARDTLRPGPVAMSFQGPSLLPALTVLENVMLPVILAGATQDAAVAGARDRLHHFSVDDLADRLPESLSGGQLQRAGLARAFSGHPRLVLVDEPTGQQDRDSAKRVIDAILALAAREGSALVVATHDAAMANTLDARWEMRDGTLRTGELAWS
jgi:predicted ABC-type transport system involved in lysophospholipase L1 biosynthesis ATPase subunit